MPEKKETPAQCCLPSRSHLDLEPAATSFHVPRRRPSSRAAVAYRGPSRRRGEARLRGSCVPARRQEDPCRRCSVEDLARAGGGARGRAYCAALVGPAGVGKTAIVEGLAQRITAGNVPDTLVGARIVMQTETIYAAVLVTSGQLRNLDPQLQVPPLHLTNTLIAAFSRAALPRLAIPLLRHILDCVLILDPAQEQRSCGNATVNAGGYGGFRLHLSGDEDTPAASTPTDRDVLPLLVAAFSLLFAAATPIRDVTDTRSSQV
ncbi:hypothetical protein ZWY2020_057110 [Hordeum vulgare]|nr:hypothetical protein ZWY2020_057110 [Hordeum vulgare]